ncbi:MAG: hypothetical protein H3Z53_03065 [archaeon]|nr:hypothetical protein [archaeon]
MTATIDGNVINVMSASENCEVIGVFIDAWEGETYKRKVKNFGIVRTWTLDCYEDNVVWASSVAKYCEDKAKADTPITLVLTDGGMSVNSSCYVLSVEITYERGEVNYRTFTLTLEEKT